MHFPKLRPTITVYAIIELLSHQTKREWYRYTRHKWPILSIQCVKTKAFRPGHSSFTRQMAHQTLLRRASGRWFPDGAIGANMKANCSWWIRKASSHPHSTVTAVFYAYFLLFGVVWLVLHPSLANWIGHFLAGFLPFCSGLWESCWYWQQHTYITNYGDLRSSDGYVWVCLYKAGLNDQR